MSNYAFGGGGSGSGGGGGDSFEFQILDRSAGDIVNVATLALAEVQANAQTNSFSTLGYGRLVVTIDLTVIGAATTLSIGSRTSGKLAPAIATPADWSYYAIDDIDELTGISTTPTYQVNVPILTGVRRYTRSFRTWGSTTSAIVWCNGANARGIVYAQRFGS